MTRAIVQAIWSHWRCHPLQLATLLSGIALATALWSAVQAINTEARANYANAAQQLAAGSLDRIVDPLGPMSLAQYRTLRRAGWQVAAVREGRLTVAGGRVDLLGVDLLSYPSLPAITEVSDVQGIAPIDALTAPGRLFAREVLAKRLRATPDLPPVIESTQVPVGTVLTDIGTAGALLGEPEQISHVVVLPNQPKGAPALDQVTPGLRRISAQGDGAIASLTDSFHLNLTAFGLLSFAVGLFIVHGTVGLAFEQRRPMIRTLRALGVPIRQLRRLLLVELMVLALIGGTLGLILGLYVAGALLPDVAATLRGLYGAPVDGVLTIRPVWVASGLGMALIGTAAASGQAFWKLSRMPLLSTPGARAWFEQTQGSVSQMAMSGLGLIALGMVTVLLADGLIAGFALLAGLLMGAALCLPLLLSRLLNIGGRTAGSALSEWVWADMKAQLPGLSLALMALLLAMAANIGVGTMVSSFRLTFTGWLDQRLTSELYVTARDDTQGGEIELWLSQHSDRVLPIRALEMEHNGAPIFVYGVVDDRTYRTHWPLLTPAQGVWGRVMRGEAILINEQMARRNNLWPGDSVTLPPDLTYPIAGVYSDYGNPTAQAILAMDELPRFGLPVPNTRFGIRLPPDRVGPVAQELRGAFDLPPGALIDQANLKARSIEIFDKTFVVTGALNILTLGVAGFAIFTSLLTLWTQRLPQLAPVWAMGVTRRQLAGLELLRSVILAALTTLLALPLGLALAWVLLAVINVEAFGWRLPMFVFPLEWAKLGALALLTALVAGLLPARRLLQLPPSDLLKVFAHER
ncbi:FtsX-like permease family protein [Tropicibacter sp. Alg240-R139]|uniref:FtsX-like permease family protein n=1 Tax=Tropicibacter sp. Alg240-R139 TaxID=2305991 RepID=UPI0013E03477|nr:ABC transporter permease [Tropicibacter sp. Alg240-R139]